MRQRYIIVAVLPEPWAKEFDSLRRKYDRWSKQWLPPHVTIIPPFEVAGNEDRLRSIESLTVDLAIEFQGWGHFTHANANVIWHNPGQPRPSDVRKLILREQPWLEQVHPSLDPYPLFSEKPHFHITVASHVPDHNCDAIWTEIKNIDLEGSFVIPRLTVFQWDAQHRRWVRLGQVPRPLNSFSGRSRPPEKRRRRRW